MALSAKTVKVLKDAGLEVGDVARLADEDLLGLPGVGPAVLADIRATYPAPVAPAVLRPTSAEVLAGADTVDDLVGAAVRVGVTEPDKAPAPTPPVESPVAPPATPVTPVTPGCTCKLPFKVTRTRQRAGRIERYCDTCGAVQGAGLGRS